MMSAKRRRRRKKDLPGIPTEEDIIKKGLDVPAPLEPLWNIFRLGRKSDHLWLADLETPITMTGAAVTVQYPMEFNFTLTKIVLYQETDVFVEDDSALDLRLNLLHPNGTPEVIYNKAGVSWPSGGERITGDTYMPSSVLEVVHNGTVDYLLYVSLEFIVHGIVA